jgi:glycosyltransferase involved in cell wall biosynthesis
LSHTLHVIIPCYNPPLGWESALAERFENFRALLDQNSVKAGLIVVNDGSTMNTSAGNFQKLETLVPDIKIISYPINMGKGHALRQGVTQSDADFCIVTDMDFPYTQDSMSLIWKTLLEKGGITAGNRDTLYYEQVPLSRRLLSKALRWLLRHLLRQPIDDSQCGLKGFDREGKAIFLKTTIHRFLFDLEFLMMAHAKVNITPVPVQLREGIVFSKVGWKILATEMRNFIGLLIKHT